MIVPVGRQSRWQTARVGVASLWHAVHVAMADVGARLIDALVWFLLLMSAGAALLVAGTYVLIGIGWALIVGGMLCIIAAMFIRKGMSGG